MYQVRLNKAHRFWKKKLKCEIFTERGTDGRRTTDDQKSTQELQFR